jgi:hypothetical protein
MADPLNDVEVRALVRTLDKETERLLLMIYHELRLQNLLTYTADGRREQIKDEHAQLAFDRLYTREDDRQIDWLEI